MRVLHSDEPVAMETHSQVLTCSIQHTLSAAQHFHLSAVFRLTRLLQRPCTHYPNVD